MPTWLYLVCCLVVSVYILLWNRLRRARALLADLPSYPQLPFVGNLLQLTGDGKSLFRLLQDMSRKSDVAMKPFQIWMGPVANIIICDPDDIKTVTHNFIEKPYYYNFGKIWLGDGLVTAPGAIWKQNIKRLVNTFNTGVVDGYQVVFNAQADKLVGKLKKHVGMEPFDVMHLLALTTLETICQTALGVASISDSIVTEEYYNAFNKCLKLLIRRGLNLLMHVEWMYRLTGTYRETMETVAVIHKVSDTILAKKLQERRNKNNKSAADTEDKKKFVALLDILLDLKETDPQLTDQLIKNEVDTIVLGGQETVANTLFYVILMIGCNPKVQEKLFDELNSIFDGSTRPVEKADLKQMEYCDAIIHETLRLFPPLPVVMRYADRDLQLKSCLVPKGTGCGINAWGVGRSKSLWGPDADEFIPERWLDGRVPNNPAAFLAFSYGRRSCIGRKYAIAILKTIIAYCVRELEFSSQAEQLELKLDVALRAVSGHLIQVKLRN